MRQRRLGTRPGHPSILKEILGTKTALIVVEGQDGAKIRPGFVYVIRPDTQMMVSDGYLRVRQRPTEHVIDMPVDHLFESLAKELVDLGAIDLIVSDLGLPDQSGLDLIRELQAGGRRPALALSGFCMEADVLASREAGFDEHLKKAVDVITLVSALRALVPGRG